MIGIIDLFIKVKNYFYLNVFFGPENAIFSHLTGDEKMKLMELADRAALSADGGVFVEIGSYLGASSCFIAAGIKNSGAAGAKLYCVDTWMNDSMSEGPRDTFDHFVKNTSRYTKFIVPIRETSASAAAKFERGINFLFIDGAHSYEAVRADADLWLPKVRKGGTVVFHDCGWAEGVKKVIGETAAPVTVSHGALANMWWGYVKC